MGIIYIYICSDLEHIYICSGEKHVHGHDTLSVTADDDEEESPKKKPSRSPTPIREPSIPPSVHSSRSSTKDVAAPPDLNPKVLERVKELLDADDAHNQFVAVNFTSEEVRSDCLKEADLETFLDKICGTNVTIFDWHAIIQCYSDAEFPLKKFFEAEVLRAEQAAEDAPFIRDSPDEETLAADILNSGGAHRQLSGTQTKTFTQSRPSSQSSRTGVTPY